MPGNCIDDQVEIHTRRCIDGDWVEEWVAQSQMNFCGPVGGDRAAKPAAPADPVATDAALALAVAMAEALGRGFAQGLKGKCGGA